MEQLTTPETKIKIVISDEFKEKYNNALHPIVLTNNRLIGYDKQLDLLDTVMYKPEDRNALLLGKQGVGKTATVEEWVRRRQNSNQPIAVLRLDVETLGELPLVKMVSRMRSLLFDLRKIQAMTVAANPGWQHPFMALFIDEIHKLNAYGPAKAKQASSMALQALKEPLARGTFPVIGATTAQEYTDNILPDLALDRRFASKIWLTSPARDTTILIEKRRLREWGKVSPVPEVSDAILGEIIDYSNAYIRTQTQPAKALGVLNTAVGFARRKHRLEPAAPFEVSRETLHDVFVSLGVRINTVKVEKGQQDPIQLVIPPELNLAYNNAFSELPMGAGTLIGYQDQLRTLDATMQMLDNRSALILGEQGVGKTALVEHWIYRRSWTDSPVVAVQLNIEALGALPVNKMITQLGRIFTTMQEIRRATDEANPNRQYMMVLFLDELHKLNAYGDIPGNGDGSSMAMNALKVGLARGEFPLIGATTDYEYRGNIVRDGAFDRRFGKVVMEEPNLDQTFAICMRRIQYWHEAHKYDFIPECSEEQVRAVIKFADAFIINQVNPAKSLAMLDKTFSFAREAHLRDNTLGHKINHEYMSLAFKAEGYTIDAPATAEHVLKVVNSQVFGQPLALTMLANVVRTSLYTPRDYRKPLMTALFVGPTGVGKTATARALAEAFFGRRDAIVMVDGGKYVTAQSSIKATQFIGDQMAVSKEKVIILDEIEKSHPTVMDSYMNMIEDGEVRDSNNVRRSLNSTVIIATSNLAAQIFSQLNDTLDLANQRDPNVFNKRLDTEWWRKEEEVRKALQVGDIDANHGMRPEFLQRFTMLVPYLPLAKRTKSMIAHEQLLKFARSMREGPMHLNIQLPRAWDHQQWARAMHTDQTPYGSEYDDKVSVLIVEDVINTEASSTGARAITHYINSQVKPAVINMYAYRQAHGLSCDGVFRLESQNASFETNSGDRPEVVVNYTEKELV